MLLKQKMRLNEHVKCLQVLLWFQIADMYNNQEQIKNKGAVDADNDNDDEYY